MSLIFSREIAIFRQNDDPKTHQHLRVGCYGYFLQFKPIKSENLHIKCIQISFAKKSWLKIYQILRQDTIFKISHILIDKVQKASGDV